MGERRYDKDVVVKAVEQSTCYADVFRQLEVKVNGGSYKWLKKLIEELGITTNHFLSKRELQIKCLPDSPKRRDYSNILDISNGERLAARVLRSFMLAYNREEKCAVCGLDEWMGMPIRLDVDHMDGISTNNHISNLQFICPNCHRQKTIVYKANPPKSFKNFENITIPKAENTHCCCDCGTRVARNSKRCKSCNKTGKFKIDWPADDELYQLLWQYPTTEVSKQLGVSDKAIEKRCRVRGIPKPPVGYWRKRTSLN